MTCREKIVSEDYYDFITDFPIGNINNFEFRDCYQTVDENINIVHIERGLVPGPDTGYFEYQSIPCLYGLIQNVGNVNQDFNPSPLILSGITQAQRPPYNLTGEGVLICFIDTGIDYTLPHFKNEFGETRIISIWDQADQSGEPPEGFLYGTEYTKEDIDDVLLNPDTSMYIAQDENGHGTRMAAVAASSNISNPNFIGAAYLADILVVKLKNAKQYLRDFYSVNENQIVYQENDIMMGIKYAEQKAQLFRRPVVIVLGLGTNIGDHGAHSALSAYVDRIAVKRNRAIVVGAGNLGNKNLHYQGNLRNSQSVEIAVERDNRGFYMEFWGSLPDLYRISLRSPGGEEVVPGELDFGQSSTYSFSFEETRLIIQATKVEPASGEQLIIFIFNSPTAGIWSFNISPVGDEFYNGSFDMWISMFADNFAENTAGAVFLNPSPDITITEPGYAQNCICVGAYNSFTGGILPFSGRGNSRGGIVRPDFVAPGAEISTPYGRTTGSSMAAAITAGAVAQFFQWAVVQGNNQFAESREIKSYLVRGATRNTALNYPNNAWGYGTLNLVNSLQNV